MNAKNTAKAVLTVGRRALTSDAAVLAASGCMAWFTATQDEPTPKAGSPKFWAAIGTAAVLLCVGAGDDTDSGAANQLRRTRPLLAAAALGHAWSAIKAPTVKDRWARGGRAIASAAGLVGAEAQRRALLRASAEADGYKTEANCLREGLHSVYARA